MPSIPPSRRATTPRRSIRRRVVDAVRSPSGRRAVLALNVLVLLAAVAPFALWEGFGPARFDDVTLGEMPDTFALEAGEPLADPGSAATADDWVADLPLDLSPTTTVTLVFSVGSRGMDADEAERLRVHDVGDRGGDGLTDTMMLVVADRATREVALLSLPRDLWLDHRDHRINATFNLEGLQAFVDDVARTVGLPIHHLVQLNFGAFARLVDAVGGVAVQVDRPLADVPAVLYVPEAGCWQFDGPAALAWARGRHTVTRDADGDWVTDRTASDFGRIERQQALLGALWDQVRSPGTIGALPDLVSAARDGLVVDEGLGVQQVRDLLQVFGEVAAGRVEGYTLPTTGKWIRGNAAQVVVPDDAAPILTRLRSWPPTPGDPAPAAASPWRHADESVLAAPATLALPSPQRCTPAEARTLPDPFGPLWGVAQSRGEVSTGSGGDTGGASDGAGDEGPAPGEEPSDGPTEAGTPSPDPTSSEDEPTPEPSPTATESEDDGGGGLPLPLPGRGGGSGG